jgi:hypothetical protein
MSFLLQRIGVALQDADPKPDIITVPARLWYDAFDELDGRIKAQYATEGMFRIKRLKTAVIRRSQTEYGTPAFTYKGVPVVPAEEYAEMMDGHTSRRVVLAV